MLEIFGSHEKFPLNAEGKHVILSPDGKYKFVLFAPFLGEKKFELFVPPEEPSFKMISFGIRITENLSINSFVVSQDLDAGISRYKLLISVLDWPYRRRDPFLASNIKVTSNGTWQYNSGTVIPS